MDLTVSSPSEASPETQTILVHYLAPLDEQHAKEHIQSAGPRLRAAKAKS